MVNKYIKDGKVAVLYSPGFGSGWYTWNGVESMVFNPRLVKAVLGESDEDVFKVAEEEYPDLYRGGVENLSVRWVTQGERFEIKGYDGSESVRIFDHDDGMVA